MTNFIGFLKIIDECKVFLLKQELDIATLRCKFSPYCKHAWSKMHCGPMCRPNCYNWNCLSLVDLDRDVTNLAGLYREVTNLAGLYRDVTNCSEKGWYRNCGCVCLLALRSINSKINWHGAYHNVDHHTKTRKCKSTF